MNTVTPVATAAPPANPNDDGAAASSDYSRALLNILEDFAAERNQFRDTQRAILNIFDDYAGEKARMTLVQKAAMNILDDFGTEKARLKDTEKAILNVLEDFSNEKNELERTKKAVLNILEDLGQEKERLESSQAEVLRSEQALRASLHEKEVLLREVHHRVKNNLQLVASLLSLQARSFGDERSRVMLEESQNRIHSIALVHETLYQSGELARVDLGEYLATLVQHLLESWMGVSGRIRISVDAANAELPLDVAIPCGLIVNELITNALKHAFPDERSGSIRVSILFETARMKLTVVDDGVGLPENLVIGGRTGGLGLQLVATLTRQLRGTVGVGRLPGTSIEIAVPVPA
jgi:two-component sensor histidine kinase